jgi:hypothetical protein
MEVFLVGLGIVAFWTCTFAFGWWLGGVTFRYRERKNK